MSDSCPPGPASRVSASVAPSAAMQSPEFLTTDHARRFMDKLFSLPPFAHHPDCACYDAHVIRCGSVVLCLGCTCMAAGAVIACGVLAWGSVSGRAVLEGWAAALWLMACGLVLYAPTLIQPFFQRKWFKVTARLMVGAAVIVLVAAGVVLPPTDGAGMVFRSAFVALFWLVFRATLRQRAVFTPDPCVRCQPAVYPFCEGNRRRLVAMLAELRAAAGPADEAFVAFASALVGESGSRAKIDVTVLQPTSRPHLTGGHPACFAGSPPTDRNTVPTCPASQR